MWDEAVIGRSSLVVGGRGVAVVGRDDQPPLSLEFLSLFAQHLKQFVNVVSALPRVLVTDRADILKDGVLLHGSIDINSAGVAITGQVIPTSAQHFSIRLIV